MTQKSIIIIGAGVAGLCAGIYGQMNGYQTSIYEKHKIPDGLVTAFRRKGYLVDVCIHWLTGSGPGIHLHRCWNEVGLLDGRKFIPEIHFSVEGNAYELQNPVVIAGTKHTWIPVRVHNHDASFAPAGKTVLTSAIFTDHRHWESLKENLSAYKVEKECVARAYLQALEQIWPGISVQVEMVNVATPLTFVRITENWKGSITGWKLTPEQSMATIPRTLPGLENFWMVGHWVFPGGGLPAAVSTAREVIWKQCKQDRKSFITK